MRDNFVVVLDLDGNELERVSLLEAFEASRFEPHLDKLRPSGDILHTNTVQVLDGSLAERSPLFRRGNLLVSLRNLNVLAILDMEQREIVWALSGQWSMQHEPSLLPNGNILLLDNRGYQGRSKVMEFDPFTQEVAWFYGGTEENGFFTERMGATERLANGNTLVSDSFNGRAFELTPEGRVVWQFDNPARAGDDDEYIAVLPELVRVDPAYTSSWLR